MFSWMLSKDWPAPWARSCTRWLWASSRCGAAPWNEKIDCFSSPTMNTVRCSRRSRPSSPAKNSATRAVMIDHWSGEVSCASSIRMCSTPPSSLNSTQAADGRSDRSARVRTIRSAKSSDPAEALAAS